MSPASVPAQPLRILHVLRAPLGGLFRHVVDLTRGQLERGHEVGLIIDSLTGGPQSEAILASLEPRLKLGLLRLPMHRNPHISDLTNLSRALAKMRATRAQVLHGHGSKGGFYARMSAFLPGAPDAIRAYTPHGGSFNYYPGSFLHGLYMKAEAVLARRTDIHLFESAFIGTCYDKYVGYDGPMKRVVLNGIGAAEAEPVLPDQDAVDFLYVGELRAAKGIDTLLDALAIVGRKLSRVPRAVLVGSGPDLAALSERAEALGLTPFISFPGPKPARVAFTLGRTLLVPSRAESLPYVVLEGAAARLPIIATNVGGIPEIFGPYANRLIDCNRPELLADAMMAELTRSDDERHARADELATYVINRFSIDNMVEAVLAGYRDALQARVHRVMARPVPASS
jgi:glycosyltransferase involved in cell wall biosynthesis